MQHTHTIFIVLEENHHSPKSNHTGADSRYNEHPRTVWKNIITVTL